MGEALTIIFSSFWCWAGTMALVTSTGWALAFPFYWYYRLKQMQLSRSYWDLTGKFN